MSNNRALQSLQQSLRPNTSFITYNNAGYFGSRRATPTSLDKFLSRVQFERLAHDIGMWREAIREMELAFNPMRVRTNRMYMDTIENGYVKSVIERWLELTTQRDYTIFQRKSGKVIESKDLTQAIEEQYWFADYIQYTAESILHGYNLISLGNIVNDSFPDLSFIPRENIRPDGINNSGKPVLTSLVYAIDGIHVTEDPLIDMCNHYMQTKSNKGSSKCGYGLLYNIAPYEIHLRHIMEWNMDYVELHGMPIKKGYTRKTGKDRDKFEAFLRNGASNSWALLDKSTDDDITYEMAQSAGTAWKCYDNIEQRLQGVICQLLLGHTDAMSTSPDKLGGNQKSNKDGDNINMVQAAINAKQISAGNYVCRKVNEVFAPRMRRLGDYVGSKIIKDLIPAGYSFGLKNDVEENEVRRRTNNDRLQVSTYVKNLNEAGWDVDETELSEWLGMKVKAAIPAKLLLQKRETVSTIKRDDDTTETEIKQETNE